jgi:capsular exopolysaccharide synthesis family protein
VPLQAELATHPSNDTAGREPIQAQIDALNRKYEPQLSSLTNQIANFQNQLSSLQVASDLLAQTPAQLTKSATVPRTPISPDPIRNAVIAIVVGLVFGIGLAFLFEYLDDTIKSDDDLRRVAGGATTLGLIPRVAGWKDRSMPRVVSLTEPTSPAAEAYRSVRTSVQFLSLDQPIRTLMITSPRPGEGKTTTVVNLAVALGLAGQRVAVVSCDLRRPRLHEFFDLSNTVGFTSVLLGSVPLSAAVQRVPGIDRISVLPSGPVPPNPSELLSSSRTADVMSAIQAEHHIEHVDSPPVLPVTDSLVLSALADAVILVATAGVTTKKEAHRAVELLRQVDAPLVGTVLNGATAHTGYEYGYGYGYTYTYEQQDLEPEPPLKGRRARKAAKQAEAEESPEVSRR